jgi:Spy/CpxP family protein refolding chaperone
MMSDARPRPLAIDPNSGHSTSRHQAVTFASWRSGSISLNSPEAEDRLNDLRPGTRLSPVLGTVVLRFQRETTMQKNLIKAVLVVVSLLFVCNVAMFAQASQTPAAQSASGDAQSTNVTDQDVEMLRADLRAQRKQIVAQNMTLTADEATKFWPIFDQYRQEAIKPNDERWAVIKEYATNYSTMTDAQAQDYIKRSTAVDQQLLSLRMKYVPIFQKVISAKKTALWYQIDRRIDLLINLQLSTVIPMVNTGK